MRKWTVVLAVERGQVTSLLSAATAGGSLRSLPAPVLRDLSSGVGYDLVGSWSGITCIQTPPSHSLAV